MMDETYTFDRWHNVTCWFFITFGAFLVCYGGAGC
jgi:hypothetical protein